MLIFVIFYLNLILIFMACQCILNRTILNHAYGYKSFLLNVYLGLTVASVTHISKAWLLPLWFRPRFGQRIFESYEQILALES